MARGLMSGGSSNKIELVGDGEFFLFSGVWLVIVEIMDVHMDSLKVHLRSTHL